MNLSQARLAGERLVVAEEGEDRRRPCCGRATGRAAEAGRAQPEGQLIAGEAEVADDELVLGKAALEERLQPAVVLHAVGQRVADDGDVIARSHLKRPIPLSREKMAWTKKEEGQGHNEGTGPACGRKGARRRPAVFKTRAKSDHERLCPTCGMFFLRPQPAYARRKKDTTFSSQDTGS